MSRRIISSNVQLGESLVVGRSLSSIEDGDFNDGFELSQEEQQLRVKEREFKLKLEQMQLEAQQQTNQILENAKNQAAQIIAGAEQELQKKMEEFEILKQQTLEEVKQQGFELGYGEGTQKAYEDVFARVTNLEAIADSSFKLKKEIILSAEKEILQLSVVIAEKILKHQLEVKPELINEIIRASISELKDKDEIKIIINPALKEQMYNFSEELKATIKGMKVIKIIEDKTIHANSAIIESPESRIDARLDAQIAEITKEIMKNFAEEPVLGEIIEKKPEKNN